MRWDPIPIPDEALTFLTGVRTITSGGDVSAMAGAANHVYLITRSMQDEYFYNGDGEMLFVLQSGDLRFWTEFGIIDAEPGEIVVIPRGIKFRVELHRRTGPRLHLRELRRHVFPSGARPDRRQLPGQSARFPHPGRGL